MLLVFLRLNPPDEVVIPGSPISDSKQYKVFAGLAMASQHAFDEVYWFAMRHLHATYMDIPEQNESLKVMEYEQAKRKTAIWVG